MSMRATFFCLLIVVFTVSCFTTKGDYSGVDVDVWDTLTISAGYDTNFVRFVKQGYNPNVHMDIMNNDDLADSCRLIIHLQGKRYEHDKSIWHCHTSVNETTSVWFGSTLVFPDSADCPNCTRLGKVMTQPAPPSHVIADTILVEKPTPKVVVLSSGP